MLDQFTSLVVLLLVVAAGESFVFQGWVEGLAVAVGIVVNAAIGFVTEIRAGPPREALQRMGSVTARVRRQGTTEDVPAQRLVPGDIPRPRVSSPRASRRAASGESAPCPSAGRGAPYRPTRTTRLMGG